MPRYVAFLRGVMPATTRMPDLQRAAEAAGFTAVRTVLGSGNVVFDSARSQARDELEQRLEAAWAAGLDRRLPTQVRPVTELQALLDADPFAAFALPPDAKRVVSFLRQPLAGAPALPIEQDGVQILVAAGTEIFTAYVPHPKGPVFMTLLERLCGQDITTRTWDTVRKCAKA